MTEYIVAARELGLLVLLLVGAYWLGRHAPGAAHWAIRAWQAEREKDRQSHKAIQESMDARAEKFIEAVGKMCKYRVDE